MGLLWSFLNWFLEDFSLSWGLRRRESDLHCADPLIPADQFLYVLFRYLTFQTEGSGEVLLPKD